MSRKIYKSAMGKSVDLGALLLQNEQTRAVGNMNVNARGDLVDGANRIIDAKNRQVQRQYRRQTNVSNTPVTGGSRPATAPAEAMVDPADTFEDLFQDDEPVVEASAEPSDASDTRGGLAAAIARTRSIKQELEKTARQRAQEQNLKKI